MIDNATKIEIQRLYHVEKWNINTIARELNLHHTTVARYLAATTQERSPLVRPKLTDPYVPFVKETLERYPNITAARIYDMLVQRGYPGKIRQIQSLVKTLRPRSHESFLRLTTIAGEQAQVDWGHFGSIEYQGHKRQLCAFVMVLSYSRAIFFYFFPSARLHCFLEGHQRAFAWFNGIPRTCLYDNLKSVVIERAGSTVRFNKDFLAFAGAYRFEPRPVGVRRGNEKGRVERAIRFIRTNFFIARKYSDIDDLNEQARQWCEHESLNRTWVQNKEKTVRDAFAEEQRVLLPLPDDIPSCEETVFVSINKTPYARHETNDYSVPPQYCRSNLILKVSSSSIRILSGTTLVAHHPRSWARHHTIEDCAHIEATKAQKLRGREASDLTTLKAACPTTEVILNLLARQHEPLGRATNQFYNLLRLYGAAQLEAAMKLALEWNNPHPNAILQYLEKQHLTPLKHLTRSISTKDERVNSLVIVPPNLACYDILLPNKEDDDE